MARLIKSQIEDVDVDVDVQLVVVAVVVAKVVAEAKDAKSAAIVTRADTPRTSAGNFIQSSRTSRAAPRMLNNLTSLTVRVPKR